MGASTTITHAILMIAAVIIASIFAFTVILKTSTLTSSISQIIFSEQSAFKTQLTITDIEYSSSKGCFEIYVKNTGYSDITEDLIEKMDVYLGGEGDGLDLYVYSSTPTLGQWNYTETLYNDNSWNVGETIIIHAYNSTEIKPPYHVKIVLPNGVGTEYTGGGIG